MFNPNDYAPQPEEKVKRSHRRTITISISADLVDRFHNEAKAAGIGPSTFASRCIRYAISQLPE